MTMRSEEFDFEGPNASEDALKRAMHLCTRVHGMRLVREDQGVPRFHEASGAIVVPVEVNAALGVVAQALYDRNPSGVRGDVTAEAVFRAAAKAGHPIKIAPAFQGTDGRWWRDGQVVPPPEAKP